MILNLLLMLLGIALVLWGADRLTDGAVAVARRMNIPQLVIGLTIVAMGTSMPEFFVSFLSAAKGTPDLAVGNVVGSNIFNTLLIVGCSAMVAPITVQSSTIKKDIPFALISSAVLLIMCLDQDISRLDAVLLALLFIVFMYFTLNGSKLSPDETPTDTSSHPLLRTVGLLLIGLCCLIFGSNLFVDSAISVARSLGVSDAVIGLTIIAGGTSLPELATSVVSARKGQSGIAIGNVLGSNVFNILMILGLTGLIAPMRIQGITSVDLSMMILSIILIWLFSYTRNTITRSEGALLTLIFIAYIAFLLKTAGA